jgi:hypothetical protein
MEHTDKGGFLMARYRRGMDNALVFPVNGPQDPHPLANQPIPSYQWQQQTGYTDNPKQ